jgi:MFS family permease
VTSSSRALPDETGPAFAEWRAHWPLVGVAAMGLALASAMNILLGVMIVPIEREFGWSRAEISSGTLIVSVMGIVFAPAAGYLIDRIGARRVGLAVVVLMCGAIMLMSTTTASLWHWWFGWSLYAIAGTATATVWLAPVSGKFLKGRGLAISMVLVGAGLSASVLPVATNYLTEQQGWRHAYLVIGALFAITALPLTWFFWHGTEEVEQPKDNAAPDEMRKLAELSGLTVREGLKSRNFWLILIAQMVGALASAALVVNLIPMLIEAKISAAQAAAMVSAQGVAATAGRFVGGWALDRWSAKWLVSGVTLGTALLPVVLLVAPGSVPLAFAVVVFNGAMSSLKYPGTVYLISRHVGAKSFGTLFGMTSTAMSIAAGISPVVANLVFDVTRSYELFLWAALPPLVISAILFAALGRYPDFTPETRSA